MTIDDIKARCEEVGECWIWQGGVSGTGYPIMKASGYKSGCQLVRRVVVELSGRELKPRQPIAASCGDKMCCNPDHLKLSTWSLIGKRAAKDGAFSGVARANKIAAARRVAHAKLTEDQAREIRLSTESGPVLAERYGINRSRVNAIKRGEAWKDYSSPWRGL
jgi:hypothetical protein